MGGIFSKKEAKKTRNNPRSVSMQARIKTEVKQGGTPQARMCLLVGIKQNRVQTIVTIRNKPT